MEVLPLRVIVESITSVSSDDAGIILGREDDQHPLLPWQYAGTSRLTYASQWRRNLNRYSDVDDNAVDNITVFGLAFFDCYLIGCTSKGEILFWELKHHEGRGNDGSTPPDNQEFSFPPSIPWSVQDFSNHSNSINTIDDSSQFKLTTSSNRPILRLRLAEGDASIALYQCHVVKNSGSAPSWLIVSGDHGVCIIDFDADILPLLSQDDPQKSAMTAVSRYRRFRSHPVIPSSSSSQWSGKYIHSAGHHSIGPPFFAEMNCIALDGNFMYGASGDSFGCYKWDLSTGQILATYHHSHCIPTQIGAPRNSGRKNYFHTVEVVHGTAMLLTGGEDGILSIWNTDTNHLVDTINLNPLVYQKIVAQGDQRHASKNSQNEMDTVCWISTCLSRDEQWWIVAGGLHLRDCVSRGYIATIHGPTRSIRSIASTPGIIQHVALYPKLSVGPQQVVAVANTHHVLYWDNLFQLHEGPSQSVWCHAPSIFAIATEQGAARRSPRMALGGVGSVVDVLEDGIRYSQQFRTD